MFNCQNCHKTSRPLTQQNKIVAVVRPKTYTRQVHNQETGITKTVFSGQGHETVKEIAVCSTCAGKMGSAVAEGETIFISGPPSEESFRRFVLAPAT